MAMSEPTALEIVREQQEYFDDMTYGDKVVLKATELRRLHAAVEREAGELAELRRWRDEAVAACAKRRCSERDALLRDAEARAERLEKERDEARQVASDATLRFDANERDAMRYQYAKPILGGEDSAEADRRAMAIAHQLMLGVQSVDEAIDAALLEGEK